MDFVKVHGPFAYCKGFQDLVDGFEVFDTRLIQNTS